jgi:hypothetical protein
VVAGGVLRLLSVRTMPSMIVMPMPGRSPSTGESLSPALTISGSVSLSKKLKFFVTYIEARSGISEVALCANLQLPGREPTASLFHSS